MIPKRIHYCWFGGNEMPEEAKACVASWRKYCPDCEIVRWDETNFDVNCCDYVREAYAARKWAFVSDYARFMILYEHGGVYFDTDVELIKPLEPIIARGAFMGLEQSGGVENSYCDVAPGLGLGSEAGTPFFREMLDYYESIHFMTADGSMNTATVVRYTTDMLKKYGLRNSPEVQQINGITVYPPEYFSPLNFNTGELKITENTYSIHHYAASWFTPMDWRILRIERKFSGRGTLVYNCGKMIALPLRLIRKLKNCGLKGTVSFLIKRIHGREGNSR